MKKGICLILMATGVIFRAAAQEMEEVRQEAEISVEEADELTSEEEKGGFTTEKDNRFFSVGLFSSADSIKTSVNVELGFKLFKKGDFEMKSFTAIVGSKIYDDEPNLYELGLMQKFTFGGKDISSPSEGRIFTWMKFLSAATGLCSAVSVLSHSIKTNSRNSCLTLRFTGKSAAERDSISMSAVRWR